jgi:uncharacterized phage-associated protein
MRLDIEKATQALNFFARAEGGTIDKMNALKLLFFADRYHLRQYGRPLSRDSYVAMRNGPVASVAYDLLKRQRSWVGDQACEFAHRFLRPIPDARGVVFKFASSALPDLDVFSASDLEALEFAWSQFGSYTGKELSYLSHFYPEWVRHEMALQANPKGAFPMNFLDFFNDPSADAFDELQFEDPFTKITDSERLDVSRDFYGEFTRLEAMMAV